MFHDPFVTRPPAPERRIKIPILRSSKKQGLNQQVLCLSDRVTSCPTHYTNRTYVCDTFLGQECDLCKKGTKPRWVSYIAVWVETRKCKMMLELTHLAADKLAARAEELGSIRGWYVKVTRAGDRPNGEMLIQAAPSGLDPEQVPACFDVKEQLRRMWGLEAEVSPKVATAEEFQLRGHDQEDLYLRKNGRVA